MCEPLDRFGKPGEPQATAVLPARVLKALKGHHVNLEQDTEVVAAT